MKKILNKKNLVFIFPFLALVFTIIAVSVNKDIVKKEPVATNNMASLTYKRVYAISEDNNLVVPLTASFQSVNSVGEEILNVLNLLKEDSEITSSNGFTYTLNKNVKINSIDLDQKVASIDFSSEFKDYPLSKERKILESLVWTLAQFDEVDGLIISVDGLILEQMPQGKTPLPSLLTKQIGINHYLGEKDPYDTTSVTVFYETEIEEQMYLIPVTRRVEKSEDQLKQIIDAMFLEIDSLSSLNELEVYQDLEILSYSKDESVVSMDLSDSTLEEEVCIKKEIYEVLMLTFNELNECDYTFNFTVLEEPILVSGYYDYSSTSVSSILYNDVAF